MFAILSAVENEFDTLQAKLAPLWKSIRHLSQDPQTIVVVPSINVDSARQRRAAAGARGAVPVSAAAAAAAAGAADLRHVAGDSSRRRRLLPRSAAGRVRGPRAEAAVSGLAARRIAAAADARSCSTRPRLIDAHPVAHSRSRSRAPGAVQHDRDGARPGGRARAFRCTAPIRSTSISARRAARARCSREEGVSHPLGVEDLHSPDEMVDAIVDMRRRKPAITKVVAKLNEGVSGEGNANIDLAGLPAPGDPAERAAVLERVEAMQFESPKMTLRALHRTSSPSTAASSKS